MKTKLLLFLTLSKFAAATLAADDSGPNFLTNGVTYYLTYNDDEAVSSKNLPNLVTIVSRAGGSWYLVTRADGNRLHLAPKLWIILNSVAAVTVSEALPAKMPDK